MHITIKLQGIMKMTGFSLTQKVKSIFFQISNQITPFEKGSLLEKGSSLLLTLNQECHDVFMSRPLRIEYKDAR